MESLSEATSGAIGALVSTSILYPLDTCKTKYQAEVRAHHQQKYRLVFSTFGSHIIMFDQNCTFLSMEVSILCLPNVVTLTQVESLFLFAQCWIFILLAPLERLVDLFHPRQLLIDYLYLYCGENIDVKRLSMQRNILVFLTLTIWGASSVIWIWIF